MRPIYLWLIFLAIGALIYCNTLYFPFVFDDHRVIADPSIDLMVQRSLSLNRSIVNFTFLLNKVLHDEWLPGYRIVNLLIHTTNAFLIYTILTSFSKIYHKKTQTRQFSMAAFFVSLLFLCHPTATQSLTYLSQRFNSFATLFFLLTIIFYVFYLENKKVKFIWLGLLASLAAYLSKEFTVSLIVIIFCIEWFWPQKDLLLTRVKRFIPFLLCSLTLPLLHILPLFNKASDANPNQLAGSNNILPTWAPESISRIDYALTQLHVFSDIYLYNFFYPLKLNIDHDYKVVTTISSIELYLIMAYSAILFSAFILKKNMPIASIGILWVFITILPTSSIIPNTEIAADHRFYLPMIGILIFIYGLLEYKNISRKTLTLFLLLPILLSVLTVHRNQIWQSEETLWLDACAKSPQKTRPLINLGGTYLDKGAYQNTLNCANLALKLEPRSYKAHYLAGRAYEALQDSKNAWASYEFVYKLLQKEEPKPKEFYQSAIGLSILLYQNKNYAAARNLIQPLEKNRKELRGTYRILAFIEFADGNRIKAKEYLDKALHLKVAFPQEFLDEFK